MNAESIKELKANGVKWFKGMDIDADEFRSIWINSPTNNIHVDRRALFIHNAQLIHTGEHAYDYSEVEYSTARTKVTIIHHEMGRFLQTPAQHLQGRGHPVLGDRKRSISQRKSTKRFVAQAKEVHRGDTFDYSKVEYKNAHTKVTIIHNKLGEYQQTPSHHLQGFGHPMQWMVDD